MFKIVLLFLMLLIRIIISIALVFLSSPFHARYMKDPII